VEVYQKDEDKRIAGDLVNVGGSNKIQEFRAIVKNCIPLLRASRPEPEFKEIYPIAAVPYGWGYLITAGVNMVSLAEFEKLVVAVDNFCNWFRSK
jgi:hypothetical protein